MLKLAKARDPTGPRNQILEIDKSQKETSQCIALRKT